MKALVTNFHIGPMTIDQNKISYQIIKTQSDTLNIFFDENMGIMPESGFLKSFKTKIDSYFCKSCNEFIAKSLEIEITNLLLQTYHTGYLFTNKSLEIIKKQRHDLILLTNANYQLIKEHLDNNHLKSINN
jgi:hypothetical protein